MNASIRDAHAEADEALLTLLGLCMNKGTGGRLTSNNWAKSEVHKAMGIRRCDEFLSIWFRVYVSSAKPETPCCFCFLQRSEPSYLWLWGRSGNVAGRHSKCSTTVIGCRTGWPCLRPMAPSLPAVEGSASAWQPVLRLNMSHYGPRVPAELGSAAVRDAKKARGKLLRSGAEGSGRGRIDKMGRNHRDPRSPEATKGYVDCASVLPEAAMALKWRPRL
jgi:hypothetical protein